MHRNGHRTSNMATDNNRYKLANSTEQIILLLKLSKKKYFKRFPLIIYQAKF